MKFETLSRKNIDPFVCLNGLNGKKGFIYKNYSLGGTKRKEYKELNEIEKAREWLNKAIIEAPYLRDPYAELLVLEYSNANYKEAINLGEKALKINKNKKSYINEQFSNDDLIYDL